MTVIDSYELAAPLASSAHGGTFLAHRSGERIDRFVVKTFKSEAVPDADEPSWDTQHFLDRARLQKHVASSGGKRWAPIHALGMTDEGAAYLVTDHFPRSLRTFVDSQPKLSETVLHAVITGVVRGLVELREISGRPHGNLKLENVFLRGDGPPRDDQIALADPAQAHRAKKDGEAGDVEAIGRLIHDLVLPGRADDASAVVSPESGPAWRRLGPRGESWRTLCADLLLRQIEGRPANLLRVGVALEALRPNTRRRVVKAVRPRRRLARRAIMASALCFLVAAGVAAPIAVDAMARRKFQTEQAAWFDALKASWADPARLSRIEADPDLKNVAAELRKPELANFDASPPADWRDRFRFDRSRAAVAAQAHVKEGLSPARWRRLAMIIGMQRDWAARGWKQPVELLSRLSDSIQPDRAADLPAEIDRVLAIAPRLEAEAPMIDQAWKRLDAAATELEGSIDAYPRAFAALLRKDVAERLNLSESAIAGVDTALVPAAVKAERLVATLKRLRAGEIDGQRVNDALAKSADPTHARLEDIDRWLASADEFVVQRDRIAPAAEELKRMLADVAADADVQSSGELQEDRKRVEMAIDRFGRTPFVTADWADGTFARRRGMIAADIDTLAAKHRENPQQWIDGLQPLATASNTINSYWERHRVELRGQAPNLAADRNALRAAKRQAMQLRGVLADLDSPILAAVPADLPEPFHAAAVARRERAVGDLLQPIDPRDARIDPVAAKRADETLREWFRDVRDLAVQFPLRKELLTLDDRPDLTWSSSEVWRDPVVQAAIKNDLARIGRLKKLADLKPVELAKAALESDQTEVAVAAWRLLAQPLRLEMTDWPSQPGELAAEHRIRQRLSKLLQSVKQRDEAQAVVNEMLTAAGDQWRRFMDHVASEKMIAEAAELVGAFGLTRRDIDRLPAIARFDLALHAANAAMNQGDDGRLAAAADQLIAAARLLRPAPAALLHRLERFKAPEPFADLKPGETFALPLPGVEGGVVFRRVEAPGVRPFYLQETETSLGQVVAAIDGARGWDEALKFAWAPPAAPLEPRPSLRGWEWTGRPARIAPSLAWSADCDFPVDFRPTRLRFNRAALSDEFGGNPSAAHPMQQIPVEAALYVAALLGCRLPTAAEWSGAYEADAKVASAVPWNLRDQTWERERKYLAAAGVAVNRWPDQGAFKPARAAEGERSRPQTDGAIFFRPINSSLAAGGHFRDLVGNVAEFVCDASEAFEEFPAADKRSAEGVRKFIGKSSGSLFVIGGSALSPAQTPWDEPLPVEKPADSYADVGFRLAFTAPARTVSEKLRWALAGQGYLWPRSPESATVSGGR